jgi:hypothetical protein
MAQLNQSKSIPASIQLPDASALAIFVNTSDNDRLYTKDNSGDLTPVGFAETDNYNDIVKLTKEIEESFFGFELEPDGRVRRGLINTDIKREQQRWKERNAGFFGRHIGRLAYLLNEEAKK